MRSKETQFFCLTERVLDCKKKVSYRIKKINLPTNTTLNSRVDPKVMTDYALRFSRALFCIK